MYAVIESGSKQYKVAIGDKLKVEKLAAAEGDSVKLDRVLMVVDGEEISVGSPVVKSPVMATVLTHGKADKIKVFKMKRRKNYRRTQGHRQKFTEIEITAIGDTKAAPAKKTPSKKKADTVAVSSTKDVEKQSAAKKTTKKTVVKKPAAKKAATKKPGVDGVGDDLTMINGISPVIEKNLPLWA